MLKGSDMNRKRLIIAFGIVCVLMVVLCFRFGYWQIIKADAMTEKAAEQQTRDTPVEAKRGTIYDRNGAELAVSGSSYSVWARPANVKSGSSEEKKQASVDTCVSTLSSILDMDADEVRELVTKEQSLVKVSKGIDKEVADKIREAELPGIELSEDTRRYYPLGSFASHLIGSVTDDNTGLSGIELQYNEYLTGVSGRWIKNTDVAGNGLSYGVEKYYEPEDGYSLVLTLDQVIQNYTENAIAKVQKKTSADRVMCIVMDPENGDVLAMAVTPDYDPNDPRTPTKKSEQKKLAKMTDEEKLEYWNKMWRNPLVSDTYEPGSTFKLLTTAIALEEGLTNMNESFVCTGSYKVADTTLHCWRKDNPHGTQNLKQAVGNSCNPVFMQLGLRIGIEKYYEYMKLFGITGKTGIDYPGEGTAILQSEDSAGPVGLATMSYGQGIAVTPIQLITAISAIGNDGVMMKPRIVKELKDKDGNIVEEYEPEKVRQILSEETADEMCEIMEYVVSDGGAGTAKVEGYRVGGKTGTAEKPDTVKGGYLSDTYSSFIGMAPMNDPKVAVLVIVDSPKGIKYGSQTAAPGAKEIISDVVRYLGIEPQYSDDEKKEMEANLTEVPDITGESLSDAIGILGGSSLKYKVQSGDKDKDFKVKDQYPKAGTEIEKNSTVYIYGSD